MRFVPGILSVLLLCTGSVSALAADARIGFVDMRVVMSKSKVADKAKKSFEQSVSVESKKINDEKKRLQASVENLRRDSAIMSEAELQKKQQSLRGELLELQKKEKAAVGEIGEQRTQLNNQIMGQVAAVVEDIARERKLIAVYERTAGGLLYADPALDISEEVASRLDKK